MNAWKRTLDDLSALEDEGFRTLSFAAGHTGAALPDPDDSADADGSPSGPGFGLAVVVPGDVADRLGPTLDSLSTPRYDVHRRTVGDRSFFVVRAIDDGRSLAVLFAGSVRLDDLRDLQDAVEDAGTLYTRFQRLDGTPVATIEHEAYEPFFSDR